MAAVGTKRSLRSSNDGEDEYGSNTKTIKSEIKLRILIKGPYTGALIGKGGENFKRLREQYGVKITGLSSRADNRVLQLDGDRHECIAILRELLPQCPEAPFPSQAKVLPFELNILVNSGKAGVVIGKGGGKMKEIRDECGGFIKVYPDCLPNSNERVVSLGGEDESVVFSLLEMVLVTLDIAPSGTKTTYYDPSKPAPTHDTTQLSFNPYSASTMVTSSTCDDIVDLAQVLITRKSMRQKQPLPPMNDFGQIETVTKLTVPNLMCGAIIGKAGNNVKHIRACSGVGQIDFSQNESGDTTSDRIITISGTQEQIQIAQQMMAQYVKNSTNISRAKGL